MILIAGGTGRLGRELVSGLLERGEPVRILTRSESSAAALRARGVDVVVGDVCRAGDVAAAVAGCSTVVSALSGFGPMGESTPRTVDRDGNLSLIRASEAAGVRRFVLLSMRGAAADSPLPLLRMKHAAEQELTRSRLDWVVLRPSPCLETYLDAVGAPLERRGSTVVFGSGKAPINFVSVHDVAELTLRLLPDASDQPPAQGRGTTIELGGPNVTLDELSAALHAAAGTPGRTRHIPVSTLRMMSYVARPFSPFLARVAQAAVLLNTTDATFDPAPERSRLPGLTFTTLTQAVRQLRSSASGTSQPGDARLPRP
jgi:uncharacterized protein YbjT (DUF2867 family)